MVTAKDYASPVRPTWCTGCGNFAIWNALKTALVESDLAPHQVMLISGIGCGSKLPDYTTANGFLSLHGRTLAVATGARLANHGLKVICTHGDGDGYGEGGNHFVSAVRRNIGIVDIVQNNRVYGLTKGQYSPTSPQGFVTRTSPQGAIEQAFNPLASAVAAGGTFVSRGWSGDIKHLVWLISEALQHRGYALIDVLQPCVTFNRKYSYDWLRPRVYKLQDDPEYDSGDRSAAWDKAQEWGGEHIPIGILYRTESLPAYEELVPALEEGPLLHQPLRVKTADQYEALKREYV
jgi:2-oxoglutarate ferredoxin oxidoreductase subunit beta